MINAIIFCLLMPFAIAFCAVTYTYILTQPGMFFYSIYHHLDIFFKTDERALEGKGPHWIFMIIIYCEKCFGGQVAFWLFLYFNFYRYNFVIFLMHIFCTLFTIFLSSIIKHKYIKQTEND